MSVDITIAIHQMTSVHTIVGTDKSCYLLFAIKYLHTLAAAKILGFFS